MLKINFGNFDHVLDLKHELGKGAFGSVYLAHDNRGKLFAVKISDCLDIVSNTIATQEIEILISLKHKNIARMYAFDFHIKKAVLVMEFCDGGNLNTRLNGPVSGDTKNRWIFQLLQAIQYLHCNKVVHRDLKPENVLLNRDEIKVTDFGISRFYFQKEMSDNNLSEYIEAFMGTFAGTPYWIAPEVFDRRYTESADIFSLGVLFYAIYTGDYLEYQNSKYYGAFVDHNGARVGIGLAMYEKGKHVLPQIPSLESEKQKMVMNKIILKMLSFKVENRISLQNALDQLNVINQGLNVTFSSPQLSNRKKSANNGVQRQTEKAVATHDGTRGVASSPSPQKANADPEKQMGILLLSVFKDADCGSWIVFLCSVVFVFCLMVYKSVFPSK